MHSSLHSRKRWLVRLLLICSLPIGLSRCEAAAKPSPIPDVAVALRWGTGSKVLVVGGGTSHDFQKWFNEADVATLRAAGSYSVNYTESSATTAQALADVDILVLSTNQKGFDSPALQTALKKFADAGKGIVLLHPAVWYNWPWEEYNREFVGGGSRGHDPIGEFTIKVIGEHPVTRGLPKSFPVVDELYHVELDRSGSPTEVLAETSASPQLGKAFPSVWIVKHPRAHIVAIAPGHDGRVHELPEYKKLLVNAVAWAVTGNPDVKSSPR